MTWLMAMIIIAMTGAGLSGGPCSMRRSLQSAGYALTAAGHTLGRENIIGMVEADPALRRLAQRGIGRLGTGLPFAGDVAELILRNCVANTYDHDSIDTVLARRLQHKLRVDFAFALQFLHVSRGRIERLTYAHQLRVILTPPRLASQVQQS